MSSCSDSNAKKKFVCRTVCVMDKNMIARMQREKESGAGSLGKVDDEEESVSITGRRVKRLGMSVTERWIRRPSKHTRDSGVVSQMMSDKITCRLCDKKRTKCSEEFFIKKLLYSSICSCVLNKRPQRP